VEFAVSGFAISAKPVFDTRQLDLLRAVFDSASLHDATHKT
jgi:hypothetical protein